ncbi:hypothetical protein IFM12276_18310 [Nocardia sputorum]|uniref:Uncharacterized protein n=1 Tax=Nocardia sputorum TaxID=2984338 RepID=A0ABM8CUZ9_9NOCA|nr:hypothetical protein IFM12276_18310 [Nocardia sputorum]
MQLSHSTHIGLAHHRAARGGGREQFPGDHQTYRTTGGRVGKACGQAGFPVGRAGSGAGAPRTIRRIVHHRGRARRFGGTRAHGRADLSALELPEDADGYVWSPGFLRDIQGQLCALGIPAARVQVEQFTPGDAGAPGRVAR